MNSKIDNLFSPIFITRIVMAKKDFQAWIMVIICVFFWGSNLNAVKAIVDSVSPLSIAAERFSIAAMIMLLLRMIQGRAESTLSRLTQCQILLLSLMGVAGFNFAIFAGLQYTSALNASLIMAINPLLTSLLSSIILKSPLHGRQVVGILISLLGVSFVITGNDWSGIKIGTGDYYILVACLCWACYNVLSLRFTINIPTLQLTRWNLVSAAVYLWVGAIIWEEPIQTLSEATDFDHTLMIYMGICGSVIAYFFWFRGIQTLGPSLTSLCLNLAPIFTLLISIYMGQSPSPTQLFGMVGVLGGVLIGSGYLSQASVSQRLKYTRKNEYPFKKQRIVACEQK